MWTTGGKTIFPELGSFPAKAVYCASREERRFCVKADEMALDRLPDRPWDISLPQMSMGESFSPEYLNLDLLGSSP